MSTPQQPLPSGFGAATTTAEILKGLDLSGKNAIVTGGYSGLGRQTAIALSQAGARVVVPARDLVRARRALEGHPEIEIEKMDLVDSSSIDAFAEKFLAKNRPLHILVNSAAIMASPLLRDSRGYEMQFSTNHLGHFQLTVRLKDALIAANGARIVSVSSLGHRYSPVIFDDPNFNKHLYTPMVGYGQAKTANILFAVELDRRAQSQNIRAFSVHPGVVVETGLGKYLDPQALKAAGVVDEEGRAIIDPSQNMKTVEQGAATQVWCATSPQLNGKGGVHCENCDIAAISDLRAGQTTMSDARVLNGVTPYAIDRENAAQLWTLSEQLVFGGEKKW